MAGDANLEWPSREFGKLKRRMRRVDVDFVKVGSRVGGVFAKHVRRQFATKGEHFNTPWKPLAKSTIKQKRRAGWGNRMLVRTGEMRQGLTKNPMDIEFYTNREGTYGSGQQKAVWQHYGTKRNGKTHIPARPLLKVTRELENDVVAVLRRQILGTKR